MKNVVKVSQEELVNILMDWNFGAQPASIQYITEPKINKEGKAVFGTVTKIAAVSCMIGFNYENSVNRQLVREGKEANFVAKPIWNGKGVRVNSRIVEHSGTGKKYLSYKFEKGLRSFHFDKELRLIPSEMLKTYFPKRVSYQPTNKEIEIRMVAIENIRKVKFRKTTYVVV